MTIQARIDRATLGKVHAAAASALLNAAEFALEDANRTVPIEEGTLARSGQVTIDTADLRASISYDTPYAARQHEDTRLRHNDGRRAKWLERTMAEDRQTIGDYIARHMRDAT